MSDETLNKKWKYDYFEIFAKNNEDKKELEHADKLKIEHFPPVIAKFYNNITEQELIKLCQGKIVLKKGKLSKNNNQIVQINYEKVLKVQLDNLMKQQIAKLEQEDPNFLKDDEKEIIDNSDFPFIKLMTLVYSKDTDEMTPEDQDKWKKYMNQFINQQIIFGMVNNYFTMNLYQDNLYSTTFQTPYNKHEVWEKYADNQGLCLTYDFKEITERNVKLLQRIFPVIYSNGKLSCDDFDYKIYNPHCGLMSKPESNFIEFDNEWEYITHHKYTETEYKMLDALLEPVYAKTMEYPPLKNIIDSMYMVEENSEINYDFDGIVADVTELFDSPEFKELINESFEKVLEITEDSIEIDFMKPEAVYLGLNFPDDKLDEYKKLTEQENVRIFKINQKDDFLYKTLL